MWWALAGGIAFIAIVIFLADQYRRLAERAGWAEAEREQSDEVIEANRRRSEMRARQRTAGDRLVDRLRRRASRRPGS